MESKILTPMKAIRAKCLDCCCGQYNEVKLCPIRDCPLYPYRDGHNPNRKGKGNNSPNISGIRPEREAEFSRNAATEV